MTMERSGNTQNHKESLECVAKDNPESVQPCC